MHAQRAPFSAVRLSPHFSPLPQLHLSMLPAVARPKAHPALPTIDDAQAFRDDVHALDDDAFVFFILPACCSVMLQPRHTLSAARFQLEQL